MPAGLSDTGLLHSLDRILDDATAFGSQSEFTVPPEFICPITQTLMLDPVVTCDGNTYERSAILAWLDKQCTAPMTGEPLRTKEVYPNTFARIQIGSYLELVRASPPTTRAPPSAAPAAQPDTSQPKHAAPPLPGTRSKGRCLRPLGCALHQLAGCHRLQRGCRRLLRGYLHRAGAKASCRRRAAALCLAPWPADQAAEERVSDGLSVSRVVPRRKRAHTRTRQ